MTDQERDKTCCEIIQQYLFDNIWNEPVSEYMINIKPMLLKKLSQHGNFSVYDRNVSLPTSNEPYYVWAVNAQDYYVGTKLPTYTWVDTATICNNYNTLVHMYGVSGAMFSKSSVYMFYNATRQMIYIAARKKMVQKTIPANSIDNVYITTYLDSDAANKISILSMYISPYTNKEHYRDQLREFLLQWRQDPWLQIYKNGVEVTDYNNLPELATDSYIDFIIDRNIVFTFDIDITNTSEDPVFLSTDQETWKQIVHIPKHLNPDNKVITHNTCDFFARRNHSDSTYGYYIHRAAGRRSVGQITHNDFSIPLFIMDAYRDYLETQLLSIHVAVRIHDKNNVLIRDANYIDLLYTEYHNDQQIIDILSGKGPEDIPWWRADQLEQSQYIKMLFDTPNYASLDHMQEYVDALGYYHTVQILCHRITETTITDGFTGKLTFPLPLLFSGHSVIPVVYLNYKHVLKRLISYTTNEDNTITIEFNSKLHINIGDKLTVIYYINDNSQVYKFQVTSSKHYIDVTCDSPIVYQEIAHPTEFHGVEKISPYSYLKCELGQNIYAYRKLDNGLTRVTFNDTLYGENFLIFNRNSAFYQSYSLESYIATGKNIAIPVETLVVNKSNTFVPIFDITNVAAYLNGDYLVRGIDYTLSLTQNEEGEKAFYEIVVQTMDHFNEDGSENVLDVIYNISSVEDESNGFVINDEIRDDTPVNLYFPNISTVHVAGRLETDITYHGVYISLPKDKYQQGDIFEVQTAIPKVVKDFIDSYSTNGDYARIEILNKYFYKHVKIVPDLLVLEKAHRIYSTFFNKFLYDVIYKQVAVTLDPDAYRMANHIKPYLYVQNTDLCFQGLDQRFIDYYPQYINYETSVTMANLIDLFVQKYMPKNVDPTVEVVYEN